MYLMVRQGLTRTRGGTKRWRAATQTQRRTRDTTKRKFLRSLLLPPTTPCCWCTRGETVWWGLSYHGQYIHASRGKPFLITGFDDDGEVNFLIAIILTPDNLIKTSQSGEDL